MPRSRLGTGESRACWLAWEAGHGAASGGEGVRCWQHEAALMMSPALGKREPVNGFGLEFRAPGAFRPPACYLTRERNGFLVLSFPSLRKGVGWDHFKGNFEAKIGKRQVS